MATRDTYEVQEWEDLPSENTPVSAERIGHIEQGIKDASDNRALKEIYDDNAINLGRKENTEIGNKSTALGGDTTASGTYSNAGGSGTTASGWGSSAWGVGSVSSGQASCAIGGGTNASGYASFACGSNTIASGNYQHVSGLFNEEDTNNQYAHIVGGGNNDNDRKNIHTLDWQGNATYAGTVESQGLILTDPATEQKYKLTIENGSIEITEVE